MHSSHGPGSRVHRAFRRLPSAAAVTLVAALVMPAIAPASARAERPHVYAITGASVIVAPGQWLENTTVVIRGGLIEAVGGDVTVPADAEVIDGADLTLHAGFIDAYSHLGMQPRQGGGGQGFDFSALLQGSQPQPGTGHPIELVHPQHRVTAELMAGEGGIDNHREIGFTAALTAPRDGIYRGWSALIALGDGHPRDLVIAPRLAQHVGFDTGNFFGGYPADLLGAVATIRQVAYDSRRYAEWQERYRTDPTGMRRPEYNDAFDALSPVYSEGHPVFVDAGSNRQLERALRLAEELDGRPILLGSGREYEMIGVLADNLDHMSGLVVPLDYPDEPDVSSEERLPYVSLDALRHWERAPGNTAALADAGIPFAITAYGMGSVGNFHENLRKAIDAGLSVDEALAALTTTPAAMLGVDAMLGTVEAGKIANLVAIDGAPFGEETAVRHVWVDGVWFEMEVDEPVGDPDAVVDPRGEWSVTGTVMGQSQSSTWNIEGSAGSYSGSATSEMGTVDFDSVSLEGNALTVVIQAPGMGAMEVTVVIEGDEFSGSTSVDLPNGQSMSISFTGERVSGPEGGVR